MIRRHDQHDLVAQERLKHQRTMRTLSTNDAELELAIQDAIDNRLGVVNAQRDDHVGVLLMERAEQRRQNPLARPRRCTDHQVARQLVALVFQAPKEIALGPENALGMAIGNIASLRRLDHATRAIDQLTPKALFKRTNCQRHGRLGDAELLSGLRKTRTIDDGNEGCELFRIHAYRSTLGPAAPSRNGDWAASK